MLKQTEKEAAIRDSLKFRKFKKVIKITLISILTILVFMIVGFYIYTLDYYSGDDTAQQMLQSDNQNIEKKGDTWIFHPEKETDPLSNTGFIFYPGGKVEAEAYVPLLAKLAKEGITCVLLEMPFHLAVFDINAADDVYESIPEIENWYIGGHSLGGAMAGSYTNKNQDKIKGIIFLGAYPIGKTKVPFIQIYGSNDLVVNREKIDLTRDNFEITGGNHGYFGNYGEQKGDGTATITRDQQQEIAVREILKFINNNK